MDMSDGEPEYPEDEENFSDDEHLYSDEDPARSDEDGDENEDEVVKSYQQIMAGGMPPVPILPPTGRLPSILAQLIKLDHPGNPLLRTPAHAFRVLPHRD